jgi:sugar phosphate isomerase/epimerase
MRGLVILTLLVSSFSCVGPQPQAITEHPITDTYDGWRLGMQAYSFRKFTFYEAIDKTASLGLDWVEAYPGQKLSPDRPDIKTNHDMSPEIRQDIKRKLAESGVRLVNYGVVGLPNDEAKCRGVFQFAKDMGIETIVSEPPLEAFDLIDTLCKEYKINVAIHNHPKPSRYWDPDTVLKTCQGRSKWIGVCADTGHWMRSGIQPLSALKKLEGRTISFHLKDLGEFGKREAHDVVWGTGKADVRAILTELHRQGFRGVFSIEYEHNWENSVPEIRQCVQYFNTVAAELNPAGWHNLLAPDLSNCTFKPGSWVVADGVLTRKGTGTKKGRSNIWTKETYGDFILDLEFKLGENTNSGVFLRTASLKDPVQTGIEMQVLDSYGKPVPDKDDCGAIYDCLAPTKNTVKKPGEWNHCTITCIANKIYVVLNGEQVIDMDLNRWTKPNRNPDGTENKFNTALKKMVRSGHVGFQDHGDPVWYRNVKIKRL